MPRVGSHGHCKRCGSGAMHRGSKRDLCRTCWLKEKPRVQERWREIKARRALKRGDTFEDASTEDEVTEVPTPLLDAIEDYEDGWTDAVPVVHTNGVAHTDSDVSATLPEPQFQEEDSMPTAAPTPAEVAADIDAQIAEAIVPEAPADLPPPLRGTGDRPRGSDNRFSERLNEEQKREIIRLYCETDEPLTEIMRAYSVSNSYIYSLLNRYSIEYRRYNTTVGVNGLPSAPPSHGGLRTPARELPPQVEQMSRVRPADAGRIEPTLEPAPAFVVHEVAEGRYQWDVEVQIVTTIKLLADSLEDAIREVRSEHPTAEIISLRRRA